jgi:aromatic-L-amino-acid/L-tryptophan decarboxylase
MMSDKRPEDTLGMSPAEMKRLGYWVVDRVVDHWCHSHEGPAIKASTPKELFDILGGPVSEEGGDALEAMQLLADVALANMQHGDHPRYFARVPGPSSFAGVLGDWLSTGMNGVAASWGGGSGPTAVEIIVCRWLAKEFGFADQSASSRPTIACKYPCLILRPRSQRIKIPSVNLL